MPTSQRLLDEIEEKISRILRNPSYYAKQRNRIEKDLISLGDSNSYWIANPKLRRAILSETETEDLDKGHASRRSVRKTAKKGIQRIQNAWKSLTPYTTPEKFLENFNSDLFLGTNGIVEGISRGELLRFRTEPVRGWMSEYVVPDADKIYLLLEGREKTRFEGKIKGLYEKVKTSTMHPVERASLIHVGISAIQPFNDGNKRVAGLLGNKWLSVCNYPPATILAGERETYMDVLQEGCIGYMENIPTKQKIFDNFYAGKVNMALDEIVADIGKFKKAKYSS